MNLQFLNSQNEYRAWLDGLKTAIYFMTPEQLEQFKVIVHVASGRKNSPEHMQSDYDGYKDGSFTQIEADAENVILEEDSEAISS